MRLTDDEADEAVLDLLQKTAVVVATTDDGQVGVWRWQTFVDDPGARPLATGDTATEALYAASLKAG